MEILASQFQRVDYKILNAKQKELFNFQKIAATFADFGFNCIKLADDWQGADFLAYHINGTTTLKIQLKSRITIQGKYSGKQICMAFAHKGFWYLIEHDRLIEKIGANTDWLQSASWIDKHGYSSTAINPKLLKELTENRLGPVYGPIAEEDDDEQAVADSV